MEKGYYKKEIRIRDNASPIDNIKKFAWADDDYEEVETWIPYSEEELLKMDKIETEAEFMSTGSNVIAEQDDAICALYEENLQLKSATADQDDAICYLFEQLTEGK